MSAPERTVNEANVKVLQEMSGYHLKRQMAYENSMAKVAKEISLEKPGPRIMNHYVGQLRALKKGRDMHKRFAAAVFEILTAQPAEEGDKA